MKFHSIPVASLFALVSLLAGAPASVSAAGNQTNSTTFPSLGGIISALLTNYDNTSRPGIGGDPTRVQVQYRINRLDNVEPKTNSFAMDLFLRLQWNDSRLAFPDKLGNESLRISPPNMIWLPDVYFYNEHDKMETLDEVVKISNNGVCFWSRHFLMTLATPFKLQDFPFDTQNLTLQVVSYSYNVQTMKLEFYPDEAGGAAFPDPSTTFSSVLWQLQSTGGQVGSIIFREGTPKYDILSFYITVKRDASSYILKYLAPLFFIALCSTLTYWIDPGAVPARVGFGVSLLLATVTLNFVLSADLPKVNYATKMDIFVAVAFIYVFIAMIEFSVIHHFKSIGKPLISSTIENYFRYSTAVSLVLVTGIVYYGTGNNINQGVTTALIVVLVIFMAGCFAGIFVDYLRKLWVGLRKKRRDEEIAAKDKGGESVKRGDDGREVAATSGDFIIAGTPSSVTAGVSTKP
ncbi:hypothetical protein HDU76_003150 [Blyttiomyces sp. JEL0837]|nr:hypothetical protein HDU76_003150 [Blyttiomyces sp. JEL0837]